MRRKLTWLAAIVLLVPAVASASLPGQWAWFDYHGLDLTYTAGAGTPGSLGRLVLENSLQAPLGGMTAAIRDQDANVLSSLGIANPNDFSVRLDGDVFVTNGVYRLEGTYEATDVTGVRKVYGQFQSAYLGFGPAPLLSNAFLINGGLGTIPGFEPILQDLDNGLWTFEGDGGDTISLNPATAYNTGTVLAFHLPGFSLPLQTFFGSNRFLSGGDMKVSVVPLPGAALLGLLGLGSVGWVQRRRAA